MDTPQMTETIEITVNGENISLNAPATIANLVALRNPRPPFAVEVNKSLVRHKEYEVTALSAGDTVEIVTLVGGG